MWNFLKNQNSGPPNWPKLQFLSPWSYLIWFHVKSELQKILKIAHCVTVKNKILRKIKMLFSCHWFYHVTMSFCWTLLKSTKSFLFSCKPRNGATKTYIKSVKGFIFSFCLVDTFELKTSTLYYTTHQRLSRWSSFLCWTYSDANLKNP